jgi:hypothetical protein
VASVGFVIERFATEDVDAATERKHLERVEHDGHVRPKPAQSQARSNAPEVEHVRRRAGVNDRPANLRLHDDAQKVTPTLEHCPPSDDLVLTSKFGVGIESDHGLKAIAVAGVGLNVLFEPAEGFFDRSDQRFGRSVCTRRLGEFFHAHRRRDV